MVKCVKDKIEIRVGGGFLSLDEFLDQYTPTELATLERKDPMRRMTDRIALQKTLQGREFTESPNASPTRSPVRGTKKKLAVWLSNKIKTWKSSTNCETLTLTEDSQQCLDPSISIEWEVKVLPLIV